MERRRKLEEKIMAEIAEEECRILVTGYNIENKSEDEVIQGLMSEIMRAGTNPREVPIVEWMKKENAEKPSLVMMNTGSQVNRDHILMNQKPNKGCDSLEDISDEI